MFNFNDFGMLSEAINAELWGNIKLCEVRLYPENMINQNDLYRWDFCYLMGEAENVYYQEVGDMFLANIAMPSKPCQFLAKLGEHQALVTIIRDSLKPDKLIGSIVLVSDKNALECIANFANGET